jgi:hypothetical protein
MSQRKSDRFIEMIQTQRTNDKQLHSVAEKSVIRKVTAAM